MAHLIGNPYSHKEFSIKRDPSAGIYDPGIGAITLLTSVHHECLLWVSIVQHGHRGVVNLSAYLKQSVLSVNTHSRAVPGNHASWKLQVIKLGLSSTAHSARLVYGWSIEWIQVSWDLHVRSSPQKYQAMLWLEIGGCAIIGLLWVLFFSYP